MAFLVCSFISASPFTFAYCSKCHPIPGGPPVHAGTWFVCPFTYQYGLGFLILATVNDVAMNILVQILQN